MNETMRKWKNRFHRTLVVMRISITEIDIFAVASADGVMHKADQRSFSAMRDCAEVKNR
jgi:hypothetical protein